jgi:acyl-CoA synthetase (AMP-forming)/AMP-acid ligase II
MPAIRTTSVRDRLANAAATPRYLWGAAASVCVDDLSTGTSFGGRLSELRDRSVLIITRDQLSAALALVELDGIARRMIICTPDLAPEHLAGIAAIAGVDAIVSDDDLPGVDALNVALHVRISPEIVPAPVSEDRVRATEWALMTSGTTGAPKLASHTLESLTAPINAAPHQQGDVVWGTFYDIRRYGGLQILLRAVLGRGSFVLSSADESPADFLARLAAHRVTHLSGTPSHWRRALMNPLARALAPRYVRLSGEIADQAVLNALRAFYPDAGLGHAYASTEAGVAFEVNDGLEGFSATTLRARPDVEIKIEDGSIRIRSTRTASRYISADGGAIADQDGFVDTGDMVELRGDRYYFLGRRTGIVNIGGSKVHPEEVEAVINRHEAVRMSVVRARRSRITGALVAADIVLVEPAGGGRTMEAIAAIRSDILATCRASLAPHKVPATIRFVSALEMGAAGKLARHEP